MSRTIALLIAAVLGAGCNGLKLRASPASVNPPVGHRRRKMARHAAVGLLLVIVVCGGCERESEIPSPYMPSPTAPSPSASAPPLAAAQIEGRVIDADFEKPIPGAHITIDFVSCPRRNCNPLDQPYGTVANEQGMFRLTANLPQDWEELMLKVENPGFEPTKTRVLAELAMNAVLRAYRAITIRPGESVQLRVLFQEWCGDEGIPCRRIIVEASADELVNLEVFPVQSQDEFGVMVEFPFNLPPLQTRLTVRGGAAWIVRSGASIASPGTGMVTVVATR
jgi:hypothetical protein